MRFLTTRHGLYLRCQISLQEGIAPLLYKNPQPIQNDKMCLDRIKKKSRTFER